MSIKKKLFYLKWRLVYDVKYGDGPFCRIYATIGKWFNPVKPLFWRKTKLPPVDLPDGYNKIVPCAYNTGDGWDLHWGALYEGQDKNVYDSIFPEPLCDIMYLSNGIHDDYQIAGWPFFIPYATGKDLERAGFYVI